MNEKEVNDPAYCEYCRQIQSTHLNTRSKWACERCGGTSLRSIDVDNDEICDPKPVRLSERSALAKTGYPDDPLSCADFEHLCDREEKCTDPLWIAEPSPLANCYRVQIGDKYFNFVNEADAKLIADVRNSLPQLLKEIRRSRGLIAEVQMVRADRETREKKLRDRVRELRRESVDAADDRRKLRLQITRMVCIIQDACRGDKTHKDAIGELAGEFEKDTKHEPEEFAAEDPTWPRDRQ